jgi:hypothetical protein
MDVGPGRNIIKKIKLCLIFFYVCVQIACHQDRGTASPQVQYTDGRAVAVSFRAAEGRGPYSVFLSGEDRTPVLGIFKNDGALHTFRPSVPFTPGYRYSVRESGDSIAGFVIHDGPEATPPEITAIHPRTDTVPENLLKCYFQFSEPMQGVGKAADFIKVTELESGKMVDVFLELESELWNREHTRLTLWLDPGRIKTDLIPNLTRGKPLIEGKKYEIRVSKDWRSAMGVPMDQDYYKTIYVVRVDKTKPDPAMWQLHIPQSGGRQLLKLHFSQKVDLLTVVDGSRISDASGRSVAGKWKGLKNNMAMLFIPEEPWKKGSYTCILDAGMEDLAGNTVNRLFDTDLAVHNVETPELEEIVMPFSIVD